VRGDEHGRVEDAVLLGADQLLAVEQQHRAVGVIDEAQRRHLTAGGDLRDGDGCARLGQREPVGLRFLGREQGNDRERAVAQRLADLERLEQAGDRCNGCECLHVASLVVGAVDRQG